MARERGTLADWHDARGFGFIQRPGGAKLYVHMKSIGKSVDRPKPGDILSYDIGEGSGGRSVALNVVNHGSPPPSKPAASATRAAVIIILLANGLMMRILPFWVGLLYVIAGIASFLFYQADKRAAEKRQWREPERRLHLLDLTFGIVGGLLAQHILRHKTYKPGFVTITALITALHVMVLGLIMFGVYAPGSLGEFFRHVSPE